MPKITTRDFKDGEAIGTSDECNEERQPREHHLTIIEDGERINLHFIEKFAYDKAIEILKFYHRMGGADEFYFDWHNHEKAEEVLKELGEL